MKIYASLIIVLLAAVTVALLSPGTTAQEPSTGKIEIKLVPPPGVVKTEQVTIALAPLTRIPWRAAGTFKVDGSGGTVNVKAGKYLLQCGQRNPTGDVHLLLRSIEVKAGETVAVTIQGGLPCEEGGKLPIAREMGPVPKAALKGAGRKSHTMKRLLEKGPLLLVFFSIENEPSQRMLPEIASLAEQIKQAGAALVGVHIQGGPPAKSLRKVCREKGMALPLVLLDDEGKWSEAFKLPAGAEADAALPTIVAFNKSKEVIFRFEGYDLNVKAKIRAVLKEFSKEE